MTNIRPGIAWSMGAAGPVLTALASDEEPTWQDFAACAEADPEAFFPEKGGSTRDAKKVCASCFVRSDCLAYALEQDERFGVWGGLSERQRRRLHERKQYVPAPVAVSSKRCPSCEQTKDADEFFRNGARHDGLDSNCKGCRGDLRKARAAA